MITSCAIDISTLLPTKLLPATLSASKSSNEETRAKSVTLLRAIATNCSDEIVRAKVVSDILALPKTGKTSSPEHRTTLFTMVGVVAPSDAVSAVIVDALGGLVGREGNEPALVALCGALSVHLAYMVRSSAPVSSATSTALAKELVSSKISTRRLLSDALGEALWSATSDQQLSSEADKLVNAVLPALEANMQTASTNPPSNPQGFLEGYAAVALALGPLRRSATAAELINHVAVQGLSVVSPKPSFVLNDKAYTKLPSAADEKWLLRCLQGMLESFGAKAPTGSVQ
jgi:hypothetical protein